MVDTLVQRYAEIYQQLREQLANQRKRSQPYREQDEKLLDELEDRLQAA